MRIVSQSKAIDIPYENHVISVNDNLVGAFNIADSQGVFLGEYSSNEKAIKAAEEIRNYYHDYKLSKLDFERQGYVPPIFQMPQAEDVE